MKIKPKLSGASQATPHLRMKRLDTSTAPVLPALCNPTTLSACLVEREASFWKEACALGENEGCEHTSWHLCLKPGGTSPDITREVFGSLFSDFLYF